MQELIKFNVKCLNLPHAHIVCTLCGEGVTLQVTTTTQYIKLNVFAALLMF